jgi:hypothetical protein
MGEDCDIPAAHVRDVDLAAVAAIDPDAAAEIARLGQLMELGEETEEEFFRLVKLLHRVGWTKKAEYLLRRNLEVGEEGWALYFEMFGTDKQDEFTAAIAAFVDQFSVELVPIENQGFLDSAYRTESQQARFDEFRLLNDPCEVRFSYASEDAPEADVSSLETDDYLILRWVNGVWEIEE